MHDHRNGRLQLAMNKLTSKKAKEIASSMVSSTEDRSPAAKRILAAATAQFESETLLCE